MKKITKVQSLLMILSFFGILLIEGCFNIFPKEEDSLCLIKPFGEKFNLEIVSVATGTTTDVVLQIKKVEDGKTKVLKTIPKYDAISGYNIKGEYMRLFIYDSLGSDIQIDTVDVKIK